MKINNPITCALLTLGMISVASVASADSTVVIGSTTYNEVFITGSTAARGNVFNAIDAASGGVFDSKPTLVPATASGSTGAYDAYGTIGGQPYCLCMDFSGSEAGLASLQAPNGVSLANPVNNALGNYPSATIPGTPEPTGFLNPNTQSTFTAHPDLSMADTSQAVSLTAPPLYPALTDYGIVGAVTFEWVKGKNSSPDSSWNDITNVTDPEMNNLLSGSQIASYFTGNANDGDDVYAVGRNRASGTHQNTMLDTLHGTANNVDQFVVADCGYNSSGQLTNGPVESVSTAGGIVEVFNDGFDSGGGVSAQLQCDEANAKDSSGYQLILLGYAGISDANSAIAVGAKALTLNGEPENDANIENGTYSYWGHEHLYGTVSESSAVQTVGHALAGTTVIEAFGAGTPNGALQRAGGLGGGEANPASTQSTIISPEYMQADKPSGGDSGYAAPLL